MNHTELSFGKFIIAQRREKDLTARELAAALGISPVYMCDIEKGRRTAYSDDLLEKLKEVLSLSEVEAERMYDLAAISKNTVSADLPEYIMENELVRTALRTARKHQVPDEKWEKFIREIVRKEE